MGIFSLFGGISATSYVYNWAVTEAKGTFSDRFQFSTQNEQERVAKFEAIALFMILALWRLNKEGTAFNKIAQQAYDAMFADFDASLREQGVGDLAVPKHIKKLGAAFQGRLKSYTTAFDKNDQTIFEKSLQKNAVCSSEQVKKISAQVWKQRNQFEKMEINKWMEGLKKLT